MFNICDILYISASKSNMCKKYGCVIVYRGKVIAAGFNQYKNKLYLGEKPLYAPNKYTIHAERAAILKVKDKSVLPRCKIYIGKITDGELVHSGPCSMCDNLIKKLKITHTKKIY